MALGVDIFSWNTGILYSELELDHNQRATYGQEISHQCGLNPGFNGTSHLKGLDLTSYILTYRLTEIVYVVYMYRHIHVHTHTPVHAPCVSMVLQHYFLRKLRTVRCPREFSCLVSTSKYGRTIHK